MMKVERSGGRISFFPLIGKIESPLDRLQIKGGEDD